MTITYTFDVSNSNLKSFIKLLFRWRGSIWKSIAVELLIWCVAYTIITLVYRLALTPQQRITFEQICHFLERYGTLLPVTYMLGYFVQHVITRWTEMVFRALGLIDNIALLVSSYVCSNSKKCELIKRTIIRYLLIIQLMAFRMISPAIKRRFPTFESIVKAGLLRKDEAERLEDVKFYVPCTWVCSIIATANAEGYISSDCGVQQLIEYVMAFRRNSLVGVLYDYFSLPICYLHVIYLCVRMFLILSLMGRQIITTETHPERQPIDSYVPVIMIFQFIFLTGWCKVAESLINPWGEDDDNFEVNFILDRNIRVGKTIVTGSTPEFPPLVKDSFWNDDEPEPLYSLETATEPQNPCVGSATNLNVHPQKTFTWVPPRNIVQSVKNIPRVIRQTHKKHFRDANERGRLYSLPGVIYTERPNIQPLRTIQGSCPSLMDLDAESLEAELPHSIKDAGGEPNNKRVRWRSSTDEGSRIGGKTIDDVKIALRKCSMNFNESTSDDDNDNNNNNNDDNDNDDSKQSETEIDSAAKQK